MSEQCPEEYRARQAAQMPTFKDNKAKKMKVKFIADKLMADGKEIQPAFQKNELQPSQSYIVTEEPAISTKITEKGSSFIAYAFSVQSRDEASAALEKVYIQPDMGDVRHVSYAYRVMENGHATEGQHDDGEYGMSSRILSHIQDGNTTNILVALARWKYGPNIGPKRFEIGD